MASDLAAIRAEGRRLLADFYAFGTEDDGFRRDRLIDFFYDHADALLADPAPGSTSTGGPTDERFLNGYPEDPVLGPYEDAAGGPSDG